MKTRTQTTPQGIMTVEVGAITGDVEIHTDDATPSEGVVVTVAYKGARDIYTVEGSPASAGTTHEEIVARLTTEGDKSTRLT